MSNYTDDGAVKPVDPDLGATKIQERQQTEHGWSGWTGGHGLRDFEDAPKGNKGRAPKPERVEPDNEPGEVDKDAW